MVSLLPELMVLNYSPDRYKAKMIQQLIETSEDDKACSDKCTSCE